MTSGLLRKIYEKIANIGKQTLHKESEEFNMKKKVLSVILAAVCTMGLMAGCGAEGSKGSTQSGSKGDSYTVGISQFAEHGSLDNCREGFLEGLKEEGIEEGKNLKVDYQNAQTDTGTASTIADSFVSEKVDMICAIATPCAASAYNSAMNADIPTVYTAVSDPVTAGLAKEDGSSVGNITGSSDVLPVEEQLKMIREMMPDAKKIGILYTTSEANSCSTIEEYKKLADKYDFEIVDTGINTSADIEIAASDLVSKVDCLCNLTDNTVVNALQTVLDKANGAKIPVFGSEIEQVKSGCVASMGIDTVLTRRETVELFYALRHPSTTPTPKPNPGTSENPGTTENPGTSEEKPTKKGCGGNIAVTASLLSAFGLLAAGLVIFYFVKEKKMI